MPSIKIRRGGGGGGEAIFQNHFLTDLGNCFLRHYYQLILGYPSGILLVAESSESSNPGRLCRGCREPGRFLSVDAAEAPVRRVV